jgi:membrane protein
MCRSPVVGGMRPYDVSRVARSVWSVLVRTVVRALEERTFEAAAGIGFFAIFSVFPVLLIAVSAGSVVLANSHTQEQVLAAIVRLVPVSRELLSKNMLVILGSRSAVGIVGLGGLIWSSTSAFTSLVRHVSRAWPQAGVRGAVKSRFIALGLVGVLTGMVVIFLLAKAAGPIASNWTELKGVIPAYATAFRLVWRVVMLAMIFCVLVLLYRWVPAARVRWADAAAGAAMATIAFAAATSAFTWFLDSGLARYNIVYGSLGTLVALLTWVYLLALIVLFGAHLCAATGHARRREPVGTGGGSRALRAEVRSGGDDEKD